MLYKRRNVILREGILYKKKECYIKRRNLILREGILYKKKECYIKRRNVILRKECCIREGMLY